MQSEKLLPIKEGGSTSDLVEFENAIVNEERFQKITNELRCLVCQNQTIADSNSGLATDLRDQVAKQIIQGKSDEEIFMYMEERYGEFVLYNPPFSNANVLLWIGPFIVLFVAIIVTAKTVKSHSKIKDKAD